MGLFFENVDDYKIGDFVRIRLTGEVGHIVSLFSNECTVEIDESGLVDNYKKSEIEKLW